MAVCNLFSTLNKRSGNFMMFSQYVEDITRNTTYGEYYRVTPSRFVALNVDYSGINIPDKENLNRAIPTYFQNYYENACAYLRKNLSNWDSYVARDLFWNVMFDGNFIRKRESGKIDVCDTVMYWGDITMQSHSERNGMGYGEIYCYIPTDGEHKTCQVVSYEKNLFMNNLNQYLEGFEDRPEYTIGSYPKRYYYERGYSFSFDDPEIGTPMSQASSYYDINTIVILYDVYTKTENGDWRLVHSSIPMGMYITGTFDGHEITNKVRKYVNSSYDVGTSYGLRVCTRFSVNSNGVVLHDSDTSIDTDNQASFNQLMTSMSECLSHMMDVVKSSNDTSQQYKELLTMVKNNRTNVPYIKDINGVDYWFINGRLIGKVDSASSGCNQLSADTIRQRLENLNDSDPNNDYTYIEDNEYGPDCLSWTARDVAKTLWKDNEDRWDDFPENINDALSITYADDTDISEILDNE